MTFTLAAAVHPFPRGHDPVGYLRIRDLAIDAGREKEERVTLGQQQFLFRNQVVGKLVAPAATTQPRPV